MKKTSFVVVPLLMLSLYALSASAQGGPRMHGMHGEMMGGPGLFPPFMLDKLALTDAQTAQIKGIMDNHKAAFQSLFEQLKTARDGQADTFYASGALDTAALTTQTQKMNQLQEQLASEKLNADLEIRAVLTPEQLAKAADVKNQMKTMHDQMKSLFQNQ